MYQLNVRLWRRLRYEGPQRRGGMALEGDAMMRALNNAKGARHTSSNCSQHGASATSQSCMGFANYWCRTGVDDDDGVAGCRR